MIGGHQHKAPAATVPFEVDWLGGRVLRPGESILSSIWMVEPYHADGLSVIASTWDDTRSSCVVTGGLVGAVYRLTCRAETSLGSIEIAEFAVRVE